MFPPNTTMTNPPDSTVSPSDEGSVIDSPEGTVSTAPFDTIIFPTRVWLVVIVVDEVIVFTGSHASPIPSPSMSSWFGFESLGQLSMILGIPSPSESINIVTMWSSTSPSGRLPVGPVIAAEEIRNLRTVSPLSPDGTVIGVAIWPLPIPIKLITLSAASNIPFLLKSIHPSTLAIPTGTVLSIVTVPPPPSTSVDDTSPSSSSLPSLSSPSVAGAIGCPSGSASGGSIAGPKNGSKNSSSKVEKRWN